MRLSSVAVQRFGIANPGKLCPVSIDSEPRNCIAPQDVYLLPGLSLCLNSMLVIEGPRNTPIYWRERGWEAALRPYCPLYSPAGRE